MAQAERRGVAGHRKYVESGFSRTGHDDADDGKGLRLTAIGIVLGLLGATAGARLLQGMLFHLAPLDATTFAIVPAMFALVALSRATCPPYTPPGSTRLPPFVRSDRC